MVNSRTRFAAVAAAAAAVALTAPSSSLAQSTASTSSSSSSSPSTSSNSTTTASSNPLIPTSISAKCQAFLEDLNGDRDLASCTSPLLSTLAAFQPSSNLTSYSDLVGASSSMSSTEAVLSALCSQPTCDDSTIRSVLTQFNGNCSQELQNRQDVVLGTYDALYVLTPLRESICTQDQDGQYCLVDIANGDMPSSSTGSNAQTASIASTVEGESTSSSSLSSSSSSSASASASASSSLSVNSTGSDKFVVLASSGGGTTEIEAPSPPSLYIQITSVAKRLLKRQQQQQQDQAASIKSSASVSASMAMSGWGGSTSASASAQASSTGSTSSSAASSNGTTSNSNSTTTLGPHSFKLPSVLPNAETYRQLSLPFLFLSPNLSSSVLCSTCTKQVLSSYISWESRQPYALGLANSPMLGGQGQLWTGTGTKCGGGFLQSVAEMAGQAELTGAAGPRLVVGGRGGYVGAAIVVIGASLVVQLVAFA
ncbi:hypothetical protein JCM10212_006417 [Sporobolomyces blumeae]